MDNQQRTRQQQACHIRYKQLQAEGVMPAELDVYDLARQVFGRYIESLKELSDSELNALRDTMEGRDSKLSQKLQRLADTLHIAPLDTWMARAADSSLALSYLKGHTLATLPFSSQWKLCQYLNTRLHDKPASNNQPTLF
jgi:hypothetical protein